jgi:hypothetical protein
VSNSQTSGNRRVALRLILALVYLVGFLALPAVSKTRDRPAQSSFRLTTTPEFMLLTVYPDSQIEGYTASLWETGYKSFVIGTALEKDAVELSFYSLATEELVRKRLLESNAISKCGLVDRACYLTIFRQLLTEIGIAPIQKSAFLFDAKSGKWVSRENPKLPGRYSDFILEHDYNSDSADAIFRNAPNAAIKRSISPTPVDKLFSRDIIRYTAGLRPSRIAFKTQYCDAISEGLAELLKESGKWEVQVFSEYEKSFSVKLKSHSGREFFYRDGYWWKAFAEITFLEDDGDGKCSKVIIYLYDTIVCGGPIDDDPDKNGRSQCYQRIEGDSKAEVDLRDHLSQILQQSYGIPDPRKRNWKK